MPRETVCPFGLRNPSVSTSSDVRDSRYQERLKNYKPDDISVSRSEVVQNHLETLGAIEYIDTESTCQVHVACLDKFR